MPAVGAMTSPKPHLFHFSQLLTAFAMATVRAPVCYLYLVRVKSSCECDCRMGGAGKAPDNVEIPLKGLCLEWGQESSVALAHYVLSWTIN